MSNDAYVPEPDTSDFYIEDMDAMYLKYMEEEAHFHYATHEFISLDMEGKLNDAIKYIKDNYPLTFSSMAKYVKDNEGI